MKAIRIMFGAAALASALPADADAAPRMQYFSVHSGTGFYVNSQYLVTNDHVVKGCSKVILKTGAHEEDATVSVEDEAHDLALILTQHAPQEFAPLRMDLTTLRKGDKVFVMGFPGDAGVRGEYTIALGRVEDLTLSAKNANPSQFYISDIVQHGNSGGPVLDTSGNVIGVVVATGVMSYVNSATQQKISEQHLGVAITLATLRDFLVDHGIYFEWQGSSILYTDIYVEDHAKSYVVNVQCRIPTDTPPTGEPVEMLQTP